MKTTIIFISMFAILSTISAAETSELWKQAVKLSKDSINIVPKKAIEVEKVFDNDGDLEEKTKSYFSIKKVNEKSVLILKKAVKNGKNVTKKVAKEKKGNEYNNKYNNPFHPDIQDKIEIVSSKETRINKQDAILVKFILKTKIEKLKGKAWFNKANGLPIMTEIKYGDFPKRKDIEIKSMSSKLIYGIMGGFLVIQKEIMKMKIIIPISFFPDFKGKVVSTITFSEFKK